MIKIRKSMKMIFNIAAESDVMRRIVGVNLYLELTKISGCFLGRL
jgi:hypothetical protein